MSSANELKQFFGKHPIIFGLFVFALVITTPIDMVNNPHRYR